MGEGFEPSTLGLREGGRDLGRYRFRWISPLFQPFRPALFRLLSVGLVAPELPQAWQSSAISGSRSN
jgi:hypothetical protein